MVGVNREIDNWRQSTDEKQKSYHYARAEKYAKQVSNSIVKNVQGEGKDETSQFFNNSAGGLITGLILLVSQYGAEDERHIISVFKLVIELNGLAGQQDPENGSQKSKLQELLSHVDDDRITNYVGASMTADVRTSMNIFSSALSKLTDFIDAELEQMICDHSPEISPEDFIAQPTAIFLICPDEDSSRHFFASLFIRYFTTQLIEMAEQSPSGRLARPVLCLWDELGNMPPIKDIDSLFTAARSRGIRILFSLQSLAQLQKSYNRTLSDIIQDSSQMLMFTFVSPTATDTAKKLSAILGKQTVLTGSVSRGTNLGRDKSSSNFQMIGRELMTADEIMRIPIGNYIVIKSGAGNIKSKLPLYTDYLKVAKPYTATVSPEYLRVKYLTGDKIRSMAKRAEYVMTKGMFD